VIATFAKNKMMEYIGFAASILIGVSLGLIGGGGSILTVPVLVYLFGVEPVLATAYSLFIVGLTSAVGSINYFSNKLVDIKTAVIFGIPSIIAVFSHQSLDCSGYSCRSNYHWQLYPHQKIAFDGVYFALLMIAASYSMIKKSTAPKEESGPRVYNYPVILLEGAVVGILTGLVGAGGGFFNYTCSGCAQ
jgi:uncharacterized membrane protein YfcA